MSKLKDDDLKLAIEHLAFEFHHYRVYREMEKHRDLLNGGAADQAVTYALLLHFRLLLQFFFNSRKRDRTHGDDVLAEDFAALDGFTSSFDSWTEQPSWVTEVLRQLHKRLAHITKTRSREYAPDMAFYSRHFAAVDSLIRQFESALPQPYQKLLRDHSRSWETRDRAILNRNQLAQKP